MEYIPEKYEILFETVDFMCENQNKLNKLSQYLNININLVKNNLLIGFDNTLNMIFMQKFNQISF